MSQASQRDLFGGAITALLPSNLVDASDLRQVPDTQEVFLYPDSDVSIIVEILERVTPSQWEEAARFHFNSIAHDNSASRSVVERIVRTPVARQPGDVTPVPIVLTGVQYARKFNRTEEDEVRILMGLYRVENKNADMVVTMNIPSGSPASASAGGQGYQAVFEEVIRSLRIADFDLFT